jgi:phytoene dehydrogenase-like protein
VVAELDAVVVGSGPNGLSAAVALAQKGLSVVVLEASDTIGGGTRTAELTLAGFRHDICSAVHPMAVLSPFFRELKLDVQWIEPAFALAHPLDDGTAAILERSVDATASRLGRDGDAYRRLVAPLVHAADGLLHDILRPLLAIPTHPIALARFGLNAIRSAESVCRRFEDDRARALFAGCAAHSIVPLDQPGTGSFGLVMVLSAHLTNWPVAKTGSQAIADALMSRLRSFGGEIRTGVRVASMRDIPASRAVIFDVTARQVATIARDALPPAYVRRLERFRYGPGLFKIDWALDGPIPWRARDCGGASTVHVGGTLEEIARHEAEVWRGRSSQRPFVLVGQQSMFDPTRAPAGKQTAWGYCHVASGSTEDMTEAIERQIERFAPGFRDRILARHTMNTAQLESHNANLIGGDISGGANTLGQFIFRPLFRLNPYATPNPRIFIGSSSTPPGGGVHGMCGYWAANAALARVFRSS